MTDTSDTAERPRRPLRRSILIGLGLAVVGGAGGFGAVSSGMLDIGRDDEKRRPGKDEMADRAFVEVTPLIISIGRAGSGRHLRFQAQLEVEASYEDDVRALMPRVVDVLNGYLRALEIGDIEDPSSLIRLRSQMLRRVQIVTGEGRVTDLLIMEFVLS